MTDDIEIVMALANFILEEQSHTRDSLVNEMFLYSNFRESMTGKPILEHFYVKDGKLEPTTCQNHLHQTMYFLNFPSMDK